MADKVRYKKAPIKERVVAIYRSIPQEEFEKRLPAWAEKISGTYPVPENIADWNIEIENKNGVPFIKSLEPKAKIKHLFWQKHPKNEHVIGMQLRQDRLVFHLCREGEKVHDFDELLPLIQEWLPRWVDHFEVTQIDGVSVEYYNILDGNFTPQFASQKGVEIGRVIKTFSNFPGNHKGITNPYDCRVRLVMDENLPRLLDYRVRSDDRSDAAVRVDFQILAFPKQKPYNAAEALSEITTQHELMLEQFTCFFTEEAKSSFL